MPEAPAPTAAVESGGPPKVEAPQPVKAGTGAESPKTRPASLDELQKMGNASALDALKALGTPTVTGGELAGNKPPQADQPTSALPDFDQPQSNPGKTIEQSLEDLDNSPNTPPSPDEEAAIARAKQILNPDAQNDVAQTNEDFVNSAKFTEPSASERAGGAKVTEANQSPTENVAPPISADAPAAEAAVDPQTTINETQVNKAIGTEEEDGEPANPQVEAALKVHKLLGQIESVNPNFDAGSDAGKALIKDLLENPEAADKVSVMLDTAKNKAAEAVAALSASGIKIDADQLTAAMVGNITEQYIAQLTQEQADESNDGSTAEAVKKRDILMKILKAIGIAMVAIATAPITVPLLAGVGAGAIAMSKK